MGKPLAVHSDNLVRVTLERQTTIGTLDFRGRRIVAQSQSTVRVVIIMLMLCSHVAAAAAGCGLHCA